MTRPKQERADLIAERIAAIVAAAPPLSAVQIAKLRILLAPGFAAVEAAKQECKEAKAA